MSKRPNIQEVITFLKNPTFGAFLQDTRNRIEDYEKKLRKKDPKMNVLQYNEYDMIRDNIETLENYLREPSRLLWEYRAEANENEKPQIQSAIDYSLGLVGEEVMHASETVAEDVEEQRREYFGKLEQVMDELQKEQLK
jgi:hypothetical protein